MRCVVASIIALLVPVPAIGCSTVDPSECWPNTSGGFGGAGTIPIGAGVGATSSGDFDSPNDGASNPCVTPIDDTSPTPPTEMGAYIRCLGMDAMTCEGMCLDIGAPCSGLALNPDRPELGTGRLKQCQRSAPGPGSTCTYCFEGPVSCTQIKAFGKPIWWLCNLPGGKGCE